MSEKKKHHHKDKESHEEDTLVMLTEENEALKNELEKANESLCEEKDRCMRLMAEYDNFKKRTIKEKDAIRCDVSSDVVLAVLPIIDNLERSLMYETDDAASLRKGIEMVIKQSEDCLKAVGVEEIPAMGEKFDPNLHNAVMHIEDEAFDEQMIVDVLMKGYRIGDKIIRHSMVKVAN